MMLVVQPPAAGLSVTYDFSMSAVTDLSSMDMPFNPIVVTEATPGVWVSTVADGIGVATVEAATGRRWSEVVFPSFGAGNVSLLLGTDLATGEGIFVSYYHSNKFVQTLYAGGGEYEEVHSGPLSLSGGQRLTAYLDGREVTIAVDGVGKVKATAPAPPLPSSTGWSQNPVGSGGGVLAAARGGDYTGTIPTAP